MCSNFLKTVYFDQCLVYAGRSLSSDIEGLNCGLCKSGYLFTLTSQFTVSVKKMSMSIHMPSNERMVERVVLWPGIATQLYICAIWYECIAGNCRAQFVFNFSIILMISI